MLIPPEPPRLWLSHDKDFHWLIALEYGRVAEDQPDDCWAMVGDRFGYLLDAPGGRLLGFRIVGFDDFDPDDPEVAAIWDPPRFDAPVLGLTNASAGEIVLAARQHFGERDSLNRVIFGVGTQHNGEEALDHWRACLEAGDAMAHYALGYTLLGLERYAEAYRHLRYYTEIAPMSAWNWAMYGRAAEATNEPAEARRAYRRAVELEDEDERTDAAELLAAMEDRAADEAGLATPGSERAAARSRDDGGPADPAGDGDARSHLVDLRPGTAVDPSTGQVVVTGGIVLDGEDLPELGRREIVAVGRAIGAAMSAGEEPKAYAHEDPNEDAVRVLRTAERTILALADGHNGEASARFALDVVVDQLADEPDAIVSDEDFVELLHLVGPVVRGMTTSLGQPESRTTIALALVVGDHVHWASMGDSLLAVVRPDGAVVRLGIPRHRFLGWPMDRDEVDDALDVGTTRLPPGGWLILASDGLTDFVPSWPGELRRATLVTAVDRLAPDDPMRELVTPTGAQVALDLVAAACGGGAGDNVSVVAMRQGMAGDAAGGGAVAGGAAAGAGRGAAAAVRDPAKDDEAALDAIMTRVLREAHEAPAPGGPADDGPTTRERILGTFLGVAVGDALGAGIEYDSLERIRRRFGPEGVTDPVPAYGQRAAITDDTQMTLFTADGLLRTAARQAHRGIGGDAVWMLDLAYSQWLRTQGVRSARRERNRRGGWLVAVPGLHHQRGPGKTCIAAMRGATEGRVEAPTNASKGCGGVMRAAPAGLTGVPDQAFGFGCEAAAITHGHPTGYLAAGALALLVARIREGDEIPEAAGRVRAELLKHPGHEETVQAVDRALLFRHLEEVGPEDVERFGEGWVADEALAIALFCAMHADSFEDGVLLAVNHGGDSDSTGAICGAILGARFGVDAIPERWLEHLELRGVIEQVADDFDAVFGDELRVDQTDEAWWERYPTE